MKFFLNLLLDLFNTGAKEVWFAYDNLVNPKGDVCVYYWYESDMLIGDVKRIFTAAKEFDRKLDQLLGLPTK